jgi:hypothetical protein
MNKKKILTGTLIVVAGLFLLSVSTVMAQCDPNNPPCEGDFDCDCDVDGSDAGLFKSDFGRSPFFFPCPPCLGPAPVEKAGQTTSYATGDDGDLEKGVPWPNPRFTDNLDGTVTDNLTGLIWLKNANCFGTRTWNNALSDCNGLSSGLCGLTDGSSAGDWRLPNLKELFSLIHFGYYNLALPNTNGNGQWTNGDPFTNVQFLYWSSNTYLTSTNIAWDVLMVDGQVNVTGKLVDQHVWCVRGGQ